MTKKDIVQQISGDTGYIQLQIKDIVERTFDAIVAALVKEGRIELRKFGVFEVRKRKPRQARNPKTGVKVEVPLKFVVTFKPGQEMAEEVGKLTALPKRPKKKKRAKPKEEKVEPAAGVLSNGEMPQEAKPRAKKVT